MNYSIKLDMMKLTNAGAMNVRGKTGAVKRCVVIPIEDNYMYVGEKGIYLDLTCFELQEKNGHSHLIKVNLPKEVRDAMSEDQRRSQPIVGDLKEIQPRPMIIEETVEASPYDTGDDLPF